MPTICIRKKIIGLMAGGSLTLLGVFLPVGGVSAATLGGVSAANLNGISAPKANLGGVSAANAGVAGVALKFLLNKDFWTGIGAEAFYDKLLNPMLSELPGFTEDTPLVESAFKSIGIQTFIAAGGAVFYTDKTGKIADNDIGALAPFASSEKVSKTVSGSFKVQGTSPENAPYLIELKTVLGQTTNGFFTDDTEVNVNGFTLETGTDKLTGEQMFAGGFSFAFIEDEFEFIGINFRTKAMKTEPVPEPITIVGSIMGLGFGALFKKEYSRKQNKIKSLEKQKA
jgi:hypothetical protein